MNPLEFNPFDGDFGCPGDRTLADEMVKARKLHLCSHCRCPIVLGELYRSRADIIDGGPMRWKWCALCCEAMVAEAECPGAFDARYQHDRFPA